MPTVRSSGAVTTQPHESYAHTTHGTGLVRCVLWRTRLPGWMAVDRIRASRRPGREVPNWAARRLENKGLGHNISVSRHYILTEAKFDGGGPRVEARGLLYLDEATWWSGGPI